MGKNQGKNTHNYDVIELTDVRIQAIRNLIKSTVNDKLRHDSPQAYQAILNFCKEFKLPEDLQQELIEALTKEPPPPPYFRPRKLP